MKNQKLIYRFHDPNPPRVAAEHILKVLMEVNALKVEQAIREAMITRESEKKAEQGSQEALYEPEEMEETEEPGEELKEEEETPSHGWEMSMVM